MEEFKKEGLVQTKESKTEETKPKMSPPWVSYYRKISSMFGNDPDIKCSFDEDSMTIKMLVDNQAKADALSQLLPETKSFGNVSVNLSIKPSNVATTPGSLFKTAFAGNPLVNDVITIEGVYDNPITYVMFNKYIMQFWDDNLGDPHGNYTTLPQTMAQELFEDTQSVLFSTVPISE